MDISFLKQILDERLADYSEAKTKLKQCLSACEDACDRILDEIESGARENADEKFDELLDIQGRLSRILFISELDIGQKLTKIVKNFERLHDPESRDFWFKKIKDGKRDI
ncbi:hypothetical protein [Rhizobium sp. IMFF44]|uniref:hypothetical protein n=1 Tax=Rhizobium sp. IMFF44 TaxID=3342350 RepID=UPI0035B72E53